MVDLESMSLGKNVKQAREDAGLSQEVLARSIGKTKQAISKIENDQFKDFEKIKSTLILIAKKLNNNDFGNPEIRKYLENSEPDLDKNQIIKNATLDEIVGIRFGGGATKVRSKDEIERLKILLDKKLADMKDE